MKKLSDMAKQIINENSNIIDRLRTNSEEIVGDLMDGDIHRDDVEQLWINFKKRLRHDNELANKEHKYENFPYDRVLTMNKNRWNKDKPIVPVNFKCEYISVDTKGVSLYGYLEDYGHDVYIKFSDTLEYRGTKTHMDNI